MAPCTGNTITPRIIRTGQMKVGDRIQLEDILASAPEFQLRSEPEEVPAASAALSEAAGPETAAPASAPVSVTEPDMTVSDSVPSLTTPLTYEQMTPYLNPGMVHTQGNQPYVTLPQTPMTTREFTETIDIADVQSYLGFLRTQIGRYMRVEQLLGSSQVENRYGFLVGIGTNYIILQEITTGNIMVIDLFTIRLTYIYYSDPVLPQDIQR